MDTGRAGRLPWDRIAFDLLILAFVALLVVRALDLRAAAMLFPVLIGVPVLIGFGFQLAVDLRRRPGRRAREKTVGGVEAAEDVLAADALGARTLIFALLIIAWVIVGAVTSLLIAFPMALLVILLASRVALLPAVAITLAMWGAAFLIFDVALGVPF